MKVVGGKVRSKIRAVAKYRSVLHQAILQKDFLPCGNVLACEKKLPVRAHDSGGNRRFVGVSAVRKYPEDQEAEQSDNDNGLYPALGNEQVAFFLNHNLLL